MPWVPNLCVGFFNIDVEFKFDSGFAGCRDLIRDHLDYWHGGFSKHIGHCSALIAELWGLLEGLRLCHHKGIQKLEVCLDADGVRSIVLGKESVWLDSWGLVRKIQKLLHLLWEMSIKHVHREANKVADKLANLGCSQGDSLFFMSCVLLLLDLYCSMI